MSRATVTRTPARTAGVATLVALAGVVFSVLFSTPIVFVSLDRLAEFVAALILSELEFVAAALVFLRRIGAGLDYLKLRGPTPQAIGFTVGGIVALFAVRFLAVAVVQALGLPVAGNSVTQLAEEGILESLLVLIPLSVFVVGPAEELLFRGVIQRYLSETFSVPAAIGIVSVLFALVHLPTTALANPDPVAVSVTLVILFGLSVVLGSLYARTENLLVPIVAHGVYDALLFALAYLAFSVRKVPTWVPVGL